MMTACINAIVSLDSMEVAAAAAAAAAAGSTDNSTMLDKATRTCKTMLDKKYAAGNTVLACMQTERAS